MRSKIICLVFILISHEFRTSNVETHNLTKHGLTLGVVRHVWLGQPGDLFIRSYKHGDGLIRLGEVV